MKVFQRGMLGMIMLLLFGCGAASQSSPAQPTVAAIANVSAYCVAANQPINAAIILGLEGNIWQADATGVQLTQLTTVQPQSIIRDATWSPDGKTLAYSLVTPPPDPALPWIQSGIICALDKATGKARLLAAGTNVESLSEPSWLPDNKTIIATNRRIILNAKKQFQSEEVSLVKIDSATGTVTELLANAQSPAVTPDGTALSFVRTDLSTGFPSLFLANIDGTNPQLFAPADALFKSFIAPRWSPDGKQLLFTALGGPGSVENRAPSRSWLARMFGAGSAAAHGDPVSLWTINRSDQTLKNLVSNVDDGRTAWNPDGSSFLYIDGFEGLMRYDMATATTQVLSPYQPYWFLEWASH